MFRAVEPEVYAEMAGMRIEAVLFDLDCTLTDRRKSVTKAADLLLRMHPFGGCCTREGFTAAMWRADRWGYRDREEFFGEIIEQTGWIGHPPMEELLRFWREDHPRCTMPQEDALGVLGELRERGLKLGIVTNGEIAVQSAKIRQLGLEAWVDAVVISEEVGVKKPHPRIFQYALERVEALAGRTVFVGDHPENDVAGSAALGMLGIWMEGAAEYPQGLLRPWRTITQLGELLDLIPMGQGRAAERALQRT